VVNCSLNLASLKDETAKLGSDLLSPQATFVLSPKYYSENVEVTAGLDLLHKYESELLALRTINRNLAAKGDATDKKIGPVYQRIVAEHEAWNKFRKELNIIPDITSNIAKLQGEIEIICNRLDLLESALTEQTEQVHSLQLESYKQHQINLTELYRRKKELSIEEAEHELRIAAFKKEQHKIELEKIKATERITEQMIKAREKERADRIREQEILLEREKEQAKLREQLTTAFQKELENFKATSEKKDKRKKKKGLTRSNKDNKSLEQVVLTDDDNGLEEFLSTADDSEYGTYTSNFSIELQKEKAVSESEEEPIVEVIPIEDLTSPQNERKEDISLTRNQDTTSKGIASSPKKQDKVPKLAITKQDTNEVVNAAPTTKEAISVAITKEVVSAETELPLSSSESSKENDSSKEAESTEDEAVPVKKTQPAVVADVDDSWM